MNPIPSSVTIWQSGKLAPHRLPTRMAFSREPWIAAALLLLSAVVFALFVGVLQQDVHRGELRRETQRARAVAEAACEATQPVASRGRCIALFAGNAPTGAQHAVVGNESTATQSAGGQLRSRE